MVEIPDYSTSLCHVQTAYAHLGNLLTFSTFHLTYFPGFTDLLFEQGRRQMGLRGSAV